MRMEKMYGRFVFCLAAVLVFVFVQFACSSEEKSSGTASSINQTMKKDSNQNPDQVNDNQVIVYYFHGNNRCFTCKKIERLTREAVFEFFKDEIDSELIKFQVINVDEPKNRHYAKDYQLFTRSVVLSDMRKGKEQQWKNLQKIWELVQNDEAFKEYIHNEINSYLS